MAEKNTFWIDRRVANYENVEALEKLIDSLSEALSEAV